MGGECCKSNGKDEKEIYTTTQEVLKNNSPKKIRSRRKDLLSAHTHKNLKKLNTELKNLLTKKFLKKDLDIKFNEISFATFEEILEKNPYYKRIIKNLEEDLNDIPYEIDTKFDNIVPIKIVDSSGDTQYYQGSFNYEGKCHGPGIWYKSNNIYSSHCINII